MVVFDAEEKNEGGDMLRKGHISLKVGQKACEGEVLGERRGEVE
jgi:hypothetical protein